MTFADYNIQIPAGRSGEVATTCPECSHTRKKSKDKCLNVNIDKRTWFCHHCGWKGVLRDAKIEYKKPVWTNNTDLSDAIIKFFEGRKISQKMVQGFQISQSTEFMPKSAKEMNCINFNYFRDGELINVKYRGRGKEFKMFKDGELIFYNLDAIKEADECYIVEGEMDALAMSEGGKHNVVSVPNGANVGKNNLQYLDNCIEYFLNKKTIILALDNDAPGRALRSELAERLGFDKCKYIEFKDCKDANDCLIKYGVQGIIEACNAVKDFPIEGCFSMADIQNDIQDMYDNGLDRGIDLQIEGFNLNIVKGYLTIVHGIPSHGKSDWVDMMTAKARLHHGWKGVFYSPENRPMQLHFSKFARKFIGKSWDGNTRITKTELKEVIEFLDGSFWFLKPEKDFSLTSILAKIRDIHMRHGIDFFVIDAWNKLEHKDVDTNYIGKCLDELVLFCEINNLHCFLVVHPAKIAKDKVTGKFEMPTMYSLSGSANFYNKADNGICVYRDFETNKTIISRQKVKFDHWGEVGYSEYEYDVASKRYYVGMPDRTNWITGNTYSLYEEMKTLRLTDEPDIF